MLATLALSQLNKCVQPALHLKHNLPTTTTTMAWQEQPFLPPSSSSSLQLQHYPPPQRLHCHLSEAGMALPCVRALPSPQAIHQSNRRSVIGAPSSARQWLSSQRVTMTHRHGSNGTPPWIHHHSKRPIPQTGHGDMIASSSSFGRTN